MNRRTNAEWMDALRDPIDDDALEDLRNILIRGLRATLSSRVDRDLDALSEDFAQDALLKILKSLETFRGESRFTTWRKNCRSMSPSQNSVDVAGKIFPFKNHRN